MEWYAGFYYFTCTLTLFSHLKASLHGTLWDLGLQDVIYTNMLVAVVPSALTETLSGSLSVIL